MPPKNHPQYERDRDPYQADRQRDAPPAQGARQQVAAERVGAEQEDARRPLHPVQPYPGREQAQQPVLFAVGEKPDRVAHLRDLGEGGLEGLRVEGLLGGIDVGAHQPSVGDPVDAGRGMVLQPLETLLDGVGREEVAEDAEQVEHDQHRAADQRQVVAAELAPHQLPLRGHPVRLLGGALAGGEGRVRPGGSGSGGAGGIPIGFGRRTHQPARASKRMRGSLATSSRSDSSVPTTVSMLIIKSSEEARNMS